MRQNRITYSKLASNSPSSASLVLGLLKGPKRSKTTQTHKGPCKERSLSKEQQKLTTQGPQVRVGTDCVPERSSQQVFKQKPHKHLGQVTVPFSTNQDSGTEAFLGTLFRQPGHQCYPGDLGRSWELKFYLTPIQDGHFIQNHLVWFLLTGQHTYFSCRYFLKQVYTSFLLFPFFYALYFFKTSPLSLCSSGWLRIWELSRRRPWIPHLPAWTCTVVSL